ncbi:MAG: hypothetical protein KME60_06710 [Cyanomargarita calcarea GSE-NOS-MK-12-04C]|uniref:Uncharacterized protein n=1 Tax=Cyanomargarita calcarea GSE-NOS-MK-12-04C TaxID=2839659 RepID=A0A951QLG3_9CYAN|nr:hypothetical protein [Cyanomargarita calcarea GSE-NOS-MK-12-04C]
MSGGFLASVRWIFGKCPVDFDKCPVDFDKCPVDFGKCPVDFWQVSGGFLAGGTL